MSTASPKEAVLAALRAAAEEPSSDARDAKATALALTLTEGETSRSSLVLWNELWPINDEGLHRVLSFVVARRVELVGEDVVPILSSFLASTTISDVSTQINTIAAIQLVNTSSDLVRAALRVDLVPFILRCLGSADLVVEPAIELILRLAEGDRLGQIVTQHQAAALQARIREWLSQNLESGVAAEASEAAEAVTPMRFQTALDLGHDAIQHAIDRLAKEPPAPDAAFPWTLACGEALRAATDSLREIALAADLGRISQSEGEILQQVRVMGSEVQSGRIAVPILEKLLQSWPRLCQAAYAWLRPDGAADRVDAPPMYALAMREGSFVLRFASKEDEHSDVASRSFELALRLLEGTSTHLDFDIRSGAVATALHALRRVIVEHDLDLSLAISDGPRVRSSRTRVSHKWVERSPRQLAVETTAETEYALTGVLEGANHRSGRVDIGLPGKVLVYDAPAEFRHKLINKVIGRIYSFEVRGGESGSHGVLLEIADTDVEVAVAEELSPPTDVATAIVGSGVVPQQDRLDRVLQLVRLLHGGKPPTPVAMRMPDTASSRRHVGYMKQAAKILRLISDTDDLVATGRTLAMLPETQAIELLAIQFQTAAVGQAWLNWAGKKDVRELDPTSAVRFLTERSDLSPSMTERRGRTLRKWVEIFRRRAFTASEDEGADE